MRISDWSSDVCSSDLRPPAGAGRHGPGRKGKKVSGVEPTLGSVLDLALLVLAGTLVAAIVRMVRGPTDADRALVADVGFAVRLSAVALLAARLAETTLYSLVMVATLAGFPTTHALY